MGIGNKPYGHLRYPYGGVGNLGIAEAAALTGYEYGHPAGGDTESDVAVQWIFDEASGNIVDEVAGVTLVATHTGDEGTITYETDTSSYSPLMAKGIALEPKSSASFEGWCFLKTSTTTEVALGTSDFVIEWVGSLGSDSNGHMAVAYIMSTCTTALQDGFFLHCARSNSTFTLRIDLSGSFTQVTFAVSPDLFDDTMRKYRLVGDRSGNAELFINGVSQASASISARASDSIPGSRVAIGCQPDAGNQFYEGILNELRLTVGNLTNDSGGPTGGP